MTPDLDVSCCGFTRKPPGGALSSNHSRKLSVRIHPPYGNLACCRRRAPCRRKFTRKQGRLGKPEEFVTAQGLGWALEPERGNPLRPGGSWAQRFGTHSAFFDTNAAFVIAAARGGAMWSRRTARTFRMAACKYWLGRALGPIEWARGGTHGQWPPFTVGRDLVHLERAPRRDVAPVRKNRQQKVAMEAGGKHAWSIPAFGEYFPVPGQGARPPGSRGGKPLDAIAALAPGEEPRRYRGSGGQPGPLDPRRPDPPIPIRRARRRTPPNEAVGGAQPSSSRDGD